jgi:hypothetical protein
VSIARWNLKEAAGKTLDRRTGIAYEACKLDEEAHISSMSNTCTESLYVDAAGISVKVRAHYPGYYSVTEPGA